jgi:hypothetical protein
LVGDLVQQIAKVKELANMFSHHKFPKNSNDEHLWAYETIFLDIWHAKENNCISLIKGENG